jgi:hypothetical protein
LLRCAIVSRKTQSIGEGGPACQKVDFLSSQATLGADAKGEPARGFDRAGCPSTRTAAIPPVILVAKSVYFYRRLPALHLMERSPAAPIPVPAGGLDRKELHMRASLPRLGFAAVALALVLVLPAAAGASPAASAAWSPPASLGLEWVSHAWSWLQALWPGVACGGDPSGQPCGTSPIRPQIGCGGDPNGQHCPGNTPTPSMAQQAGGLQAPSARLALHSRRRR